MGASGSHSLLAVRGLLFAVASLAEHRLQGTQASAVADSGLDGTGSVVVAHRLGCSMACGIFLDQGLNPCLLHWQADSSPLSHQGGPGKLIFDSDFKLLLLGSTEN